MLKKSSTRISKQSSTTRSRVKNITRGRGRIRPIKEIQYVLPLGNGWVVKNNAALRFTAITDTKREAISIAREIARTKRIRLIVHRRDGSVELRETY